MYILIIQNSAEQLDLDRTGKKETSRKSGMSGAVLSPDAHTSCAFLAKLCIYVFFGEVNLFSLSWKLLIKYISESYFLCDF